MKSDLEQHDNSHISPYSIQMYNPFDINNWPINKVIAVVLAVQFALMIMVLLQQIGLNIPILRPLMGFLYLTLVPGILALRILRIHELTGIEQSLITVGLSLSTLMSIGFIINVIYPILGISRPISVDSILVTINAIVFLLSFLAYKREKDLIHSNYVESKFTLSPPGLFLCLLPFMSIFGTFLVNSYKNNALLMFLIVIIALIVLLIGFDMVILRNLYPLAVFSIAISLLYHNSLISAYIWGWDIQLEYSVYRSIISNSYWDFTFPGSVNGMLSVSVIPATYSYILDIGGDTVFKVVYPAIFSLLPLGLYDIYKKEMSEKIAFFSAFYFMSIFTFFVGMLTLPRQQIAELFLLLIILLITNNSKIDLMNRRILLIIFSMGMVTSHYGLTYLLLLFIWVGYIFLNYALGQKNELYTLRFMSFLYIFALLWYMFIMSGKLFEIIIQIGISAYANLHNDLFATTSISLIRHETHRVTENVARYLYIISQFFIIIGFLRVLSSQFFRSESIIGIIYRRYGSRLNLNATRTYEAHSNFSNEYVTLSLIGILVMSATIITSSTGMDILRLFHVASILISPFCAIGCIFTLNFLRSKLKRSESYSKTAGSLKIFSIFLAIFFLFNSAFISEIVRDYPHSISLSQESIKEYPDPKDKFFLYNLYNVHEQDVFSAMWFNSNLIEGHHLRVYSDFLSFFPLLGYGMLSEKYHVMLNNNTLRLPSEAFVFLSYPNIKENLAATADYSFYTAELNPLLSETNRIYSNGGSDIYIKL